MSLEVYEFQYARIMTRELALDLNQVRKYELQIYYPTVFCKRMMLFSPKSKNTTKMHKRENIQMIAGHPQSSNQEVAKKKENFEY